MKLQISDKFTYSRLIKFTAPSIVMMIITSIYGVIDGLFVSNYVGEVEFAALNLIYPLLMVMSSFGFMIGTGGCALIAKYLGEGKRQKANEIFAMLVMLLILLGTALATISIIFIKPISLLLGATPELLGGCITYGVIMLIALPFFMLQTSFMSFAVVAELPKMGMQLSIVSGITNIVLDYVLIVEFEMGLAGAAWATGLSQFVGGVFPLFYFLSKKNNSNLRLVKFKWDFKAVASTCTNGASEMMSSISGSLVNILYNIQLMRYIGADGVSAYGIIMYISFIFAAVFIGYAIGVSPIISYHFGAGDKHELQSLFKKSFIIMMASSIILTAIAIVFARPLSAIFVSYNAELLALSIRAMMIYSIAYLFMSVNYFSSAFFTALNNGKVSAFVSFLRTFALQVLFVFLLPPLMGLDGIWLSVVVANFICFFVSLLLFKIYGKTYGYLSSKPAISTN